MKHNAGNDWQAGIMGDAARTNAGTGISRAADYIGLTEDNTAPAAGDTTLTGELAAGGLARAQGTYGHTGGAASYTISKTFTSSDATARTLRKAALFNASANGIMPFSSLITNPPTLQGTTSDQATVTVTVNL